MDYSPFAAGSSPYSTYAYGSHPTEFTLAFTRDSSRSVSSSHPHPQQTRPQKDHRQEQALLASSTHSPVDSQQDALMHPLSSSPAMSHLQLLSPTESLDWPVTLADEDVNYTERGIAGFVTKLYQSLQPSEDGYRHARWCTHNSTDMFIIDSIPKYTEHILPRLFKHKKFASFVRQLNIYGFRRDTDARKSKDSRDKETCRWYHPYFRPDRRDLFHLIRRKTPRCTRRKRSRTTEDPETILNVGGSGEEEELDNNNGDSLPTSRRPSSVSVLSIASAVSADSASGPSGTTATATVMATTSAAPSPTPMSTPQTTAVTPMATVTTIPDYSNNKLQQAYRQSNSQQQQNHLHHHQPQHQHQQKQEHLPPCQPVQEMLQTFGDMKQPQTQPQGQQVDVLSYMQAMRRSCHQAVAENRAQSSPVVVTFPDALVDDAMPMTEYELRLKLARLQAAYQQMTQHYTTQVNTANRHIHSLNAWIQQLEQTLRSLRMPPPSSQVYSAQPCTETSGYQPLANDYFSHVPVSQSGHLSAQPSPGHHVPANATTTTAGTTSAGTVATPTQALTVTPAKNDAGLVSSESLNFFFSNPVVRGEHLASATHMMDTDTVLEGDITWLSPFTSTASPATDTIEPSTSVSRFVQEPSKFSLSLEYPADA